MRRFIALPSVMLPASIAAVIVAQALFTFSAILESQRLTRLILARAAVSVQFHELETLLYRQRQAEHSYALAPAAPFAAVRQRSYAQFVSRAARLRAAVPGERAAQLLELERQMDGYHAAGNAAMTRFGARDASGGLRADRTSVEPVYQRLRAHLTGVVSDFRARTMKLNDQAVRAQRRLAYEAAAVCAVGVVLSIGLLVRLESYRRKAEDATAQRLHALNQAMRTDALTGLPNDRAFHERAALLTYAQAARGSSGALLLLDVDDFKTVNDARGHEHGDRLITLLGETLNRSRGAAALFRLGADRFAMLWDTEGGAMPLEDALSAWRAASRVLGGITVSGGYSERRASPGEIDLLQAARAALRRAKQTGGNRLVNACDLGGGFISSPRKARAVRDILSERSIPVVLQAIVDTRTERTIAFEALARPPARYGLHGPEEMFDIAERLYRNYELDEICVRSALGALAGRPSETQLFVNVVPASLESERIDVPACFRQMARAGISPARVVLELTERKISNINALAARIEELRERGFRVALDDTGAGYAGLDVLSKLTFDFVKIDRSLIVRAMQDSRARGVLSGILAIAQETGSSVIAEGIETPGMYAFAREFHARTLTTSISAVQGYLFGMPEEAGRAPA